MKNIVCLALGGAVLSAAVVLGGVGFGASPSNAADLKLGAFHVAAASDA